MDKIQEAKKKANTLRKTLAELDRLTGTKQERESDAERKRKQRAVERDLVISKPKDPIRRADCIADTYLFLQTYFGGIFSQDFTATRRQMIDGIEHASRFGGDQAIAGPRGEGKSRSALFVTLKLMLEGALRFPLIVSKSGPRAKRELKNWQEAIIASEILHADFPELCEPILALGGWSSRARQQTAFGLYTRMEWGTETVVFPTIPSERLGFESVARGQIMSSLGIEGAIRGFSVRNERPDLVLIDDIDDRESARSELQTETREQILEEDIGGLAGPDKTIARVMLCTLLNQTCIAATYTDPSLKPSWRGQRHKLLAKMPERMDLWEEYISLREGRDNEDPDARNAHRFYLQHRDEMDAGAEVTNPQRFDSRLLADGEANQVSALQACFDLIADRGWVAFNCEFQNDPPEEDGPIESGISAKRIQRQLSNYERYAVPPNCISLTMGVDVQKAGLYYVTKAWQTDATSYVIDYGFFETQGTKYASEEGVEFAIRRAILGLLEENQDKYFDQGGEIRRLDLTLVDSGWQTQAVYAACAEIGLGIYPAKGHGKSHGCTTPSFSEQLRRTTDKKPGDGWFLQRQPKGIWLCHCETDRWKTFEHDRWMTNPGNPGCTYLYGMMTDEEQRDIDRRLPRESRDHFGFAKHLTFEIETEDIVRGKMVRLWKAKSGRAQNHYFDASYLANVAGSITGIRLLGQNTRQRVAPEDRPSARELAGRK